MIQIYPLLLLHLLDPPSTHNRMKYELHMVKECPGKTGEISHIPVRLKLLCAFA